MKEIIGKDSDGKDIMLTFQEVPPVSFPGRQYRNWVWDKKKHSWVRREK